MSQPQGPRRWRVRRDATALVALLVLLGCASGGGAGTARQYFAGFDEGWYAALETARELGASIRTRHRPSGHIVARLTAPELGATGALDISVQSLGTGDRSRGFSINAVASVGGTQPEDLERREALRTLEERFLQLFDRALRDRQRLGSGLL